MAGGGSLGGDSKPKRGKANKRKKMKRISFHLDMTPLVDITFLLLTFFMFTTTMAAPQVMEMQVPPEIIKEVDVKCSELFTIVVWKDGKILYFVCEDEPKEIDVKKIKALAERENLKEDVKNRLITALQVHDDAPYGTVVSILDELNLAEVGITEAIESAGDLDEEGNPVKRKRKFTIAKLTKDNVKKVEEFLGIENTEEE